MPRISRTIIAGAAALAFSITLNTSPAAASVSRGYIDENAGAQNDFSDEATLWSGSSYRNSNSVGVVQAILYAEYIINAVDVDCFYGSTTTWGVKELQKKLGFTGNDVDGVVGPKTWRKLDDRLIEGSIYSDSMRYIKYRATNGTTPNLFLRARVSGGTYMFKYYGGYFGGNEGWKQALYSSLSGRECS
ncbi:peptidoglycan-binding protein [Streptomyces sp. TRM72054]|uniref:peptidoglycan-binding domain-containing protein n=1 Tax=Streptomyces sp. TRM72054 TaxID=2870562 RepID=UPI001C8B208E|nr:peptidoglycan-binding domain-containing protein [Streptomyces sp. TRM72054]MBX9397160.1 peptidoglycan-binding protein [Streptomyces sp. TRM72054]